MTVIFAATIGAKALYLLFLWLASAIAGAWLSHRKGYGERAGLASGLLLTFIGPLLWLIFPARADSRWKQEGPFPKRHNLRIVCCSFSAVIPGAIVRVPIAVLFAIGLVVLIVVGEQIVQREAVMSRDKVDARPWLPPASIELY